MGLKLGCSMAGRSFRHCALLHSLVCSRDTVQRLINREGEPGNMIPHAHAECFHTQEKAEQRFAEALAAGDVMKLDL